MSATSASARDPAALAAFYRDVLGLQAVPTDTSALGATAFLSSRPAEQSLDMALFADPALESPEDEHHEKQEQSGMASLTLSFA